jgi:DNA repair exonuclease SbcCD ATPase subunit
MALLFQKIRWKNLLSTGNDFIELSLNNPGTTLIVGENGAGKSQFMDALTFALFGKPFRNINKPQLINTITSKELLVELEFLIGKNSYTICRGMKPNIFEVYRNGALLNQDAEVKDYQDLLEKKILKTNYKTFCQVVVLGSASYTSFMQLPAAQRRAIIEDLLDLQVFTIMNILLKTQAQDNLDKITECINEQRLIAEKIKLLRLHLSELKSKSDQFVKEKTVTILDLEFKIAELQNEKEQLKVQSNSFLEKTTGINSLSTKVDRLKTIRVQMEAKISILDKEIKFFEINSSCPTCKQAIDHKFSCNIVENRSTEIQSIRAGLDQLSNMYEKVQRQLKDLLELDKQYEDIMTQISHNTLKIKMYRDQIDSLCKEIKCAEIQTNDSTGDLKVADLEKELNTLSVKYNDLQDDKLVFAAAASLLKDGGIKTKIVNQYVPIINKLIGKYLSEFDLFVEFNLDDQFNEVIKSRYRDEFTYASFSEGEKQKIDLAILFTWRAVAKLRNSLNTNLLILDEVTDRSLDHGGLDSLQKILKTKENTSIFIISHRSELKESPIFDKIISFTKNKNFSKMEEV